MAQLKKNDAPEAIDLNQVLATSTAPMAILSQEKLGIAVLMRQTVRDGHYMTFLSDTGQSLTFQQGTLIATRGSGNDLMSSELGTLPDLIRTRREGKGTRQMHYLNGEGQTLTLTFRCEVQRGDTEPFASGVINTTARLMAETCKGDDGYEFTNAYLVSQNGTVLSGRHWLNPQTGSVVFQRLR